MVFTEKFRNAADQNFDCCFVVFDLSFDKTPDFYFCETSGRLKAAENCSLDDDIGLNMKNLQEF